MIAILTIPSWHFVTEKIGPSEMRWVRYKRGRKGLKQTTDKPFLHEACGEAFRQRDQVSAEAKDMFN
jgi:hypothetical protein